MNRQVDSGVHLALACMYTIYKTWGKYPQEIAHIMQEILDLDRRYYAEGEKHERSRKAKERPSGTA